jgi:predicted metal-dependent peptidase
MPSGLIEEIIREEVFKQDLSRFVRVVNGRISIGYKSTRLRINRRVEQFSGHKRTLGAKVLIALDTSGSMSSDDLKRTFDVIESLKYKAQLWISYCDTKVSEPIKLKDNIQKLQALGRGGTDLNPVLSYSDDFDFTIIITDGYMSELQTTLRQERTIGILFANEELYNEHIKSRAWNKFLCGFVRTKR